MSNWNNIKPYRQVRLTTPFTKGDDVRLIQNRLNLKEDGEYGPATGSAVAAWKRRAGYPAKMIISSIGVPGQLYLSGRKPLPLAYRLRAKSRSKAVAKAIASRPVRVKAMETMVAWSNVPLVEHPSGSNRVPELQNMARALNLSDYYHNMGWPWCAFAVNLAMLRHGSKTAALGLREGKFNALYTVDILNKALNNEYGMRVVGASQAQPGDLVMMNFPGGDPRVDHVGMVRKAPAGGSVQTVEGNTSLSGSQDNGGGVFLKNRPLSNVSAFIRYQ